MSAKRFYAAADRTANFKLHPNGNAPQQDKPDQRTEADLNPTELFLLKTSPTDYGNALCVQKLAGGRFAINEALGLMVYDGKRWTTQKAEALLSEEIVKTLKRRAYLAIEFEKGELLKKSALNNSNISACKTRFKELPDLYVPVDCFDAHPNLLNCTNGTVDLHTGAVYPHDPKNYITHLIDYEYKPDKSQTAWLAFLSTVIGGYQDFTIANYVKMLAGYSATGETREEIIIYLYGKQGRNGKGVFVDVIQALLGSYATGCEFNTLTRRRDGGDQGFDIAGLRGSRWVVTSESGKEDKLNEAAVKHLTGRDTLQVAKKNKDPFSFKPTFKIWALSNHEPRGDVDDDAFWNRLKIITFPYSFAGREDKTLRDRLMSKDVLEGVLAWIVEGAVAWYATGGKGLQTPDQIKQKIQDTRDAQDSVRSWIKADCVTGEAAGFYATEILHKAYEQWCDENERDDVKTLRVLGKRLSEMSFEQKRIKLNPRADKWVRGFVGIRPKTPFERGDFKES
ncbi:MAG: phage/plasmid primase, P4 family [Caldilineaceae bacterium]